MRVHREGHGVDQVTGDGAAAGWVVTRQAVTVESVSSNRSGHGGWHPGERGRSAGRRRARGSPDVEDGGVEDEGGAGGAGRAATARRAARGEDERERGRGRDRYSTYLNLAGFFHILVGAQFAYTRRRDLQPVVLLSL